MVEAGTGSVGQECSAGVITVGQFAFVGFTGDPVFFTQFARVDGVEFFQLV
ncbi:hypothetical protein D3C76_1491550 [compost metagenome]